MQYDPIKRSLGKVFNQTPYLRILFYRLLDLLLLRSWHIRRAVRQWKKQASGVENILDAGSGFGQYVYYLSSLNVNWKVTGVDVKEEQIEDCNNFFRKIGCADRVQFRYADLTKFSEPDKYDFVLSVDVMEHIEEDEMVFRNFFHSMRKGGMLLISTPSDQGGSDTHDHDHHGEEASGFIDEHVRDGYNVQDIADKLKRAGFSAIETAYSYGTPGKLSWKLSMKYPILMLNASKLFFILIPFYYLITYPLAFVLNMFDVRGKHQTGTGLIVKAKKL
ncbi:class I SAM-dependent methyltransferase [Marinilabiliaceae bacterium JC017]|nr:class I SAM-dependent methyltransferase [Marinilabiliaceae bacterium JC017]